MSNTLTFNPYELATCIINRLPPLTSKIPTNPLCDPTYIPCTGREGRKIPTFSDVVALKKPMFLEVWDDDFGLVESVSDILGEDCGEVVWGNR